MNEQSKWTAKTGTSTRNRGRLWRTKIISVWRGRHFNVSAGTWFLSLQKRVRITSGHKVNEIIGENKYLLCKVRTPRRPRSKRIKSQIKQPAGDISVATVALITAEQRKEKQKACHRTVFPSLFQSQHRLNILKKTVSVKPGLLLDASAIAQVTVRINWRHCGGQVELECRRSVPVRTAMKWVTWSWLLLKGPIVQASLWFIYEGP